MPGRPPVPIAVHKKRGTFQKVRHAGKASAPDVPLGKVSPKWFGKVVEVEIAKATLALTIGDLTAEWMLDILTAEWDRISNLSYIKAAHSGEAQHYCLLYLRMVLDAVGVRPMTSSERATLHSISMQLALTPASESKVNAAPPGKADDPWDKLDRLG